MGGAGSWDIYFFFCIRLYWIYSTWIRHLKEIKQSCLLGPLLAPSPCLSVAKPFSSYPCITIPVDLSSPFKPNLTFELRILLLKCLLHKSTWMSLRHTNSTCPKLNTLISPKMLPFQRPPPPPIAPHPIYPIAQSRNLGHHCWSNPPPPACHPPVDTTSKDLANHFFPPLWPLYHPCFHSFNKYLLTTSCVPGTGGWGWHTMENKTDVLFSWMEPCVRQKAWTINK